MAILYTGYVLPRLDEAPKVIIGKNSKYSSVNPSKPKGFHVTVDILPNLKKMEFIDHDL